MPEGIGSRLVFVDGAGGEGLWSSAAAVTPAYTGGVRCAIGGVVFFKWSAMYHDLVKMASKAHYDACDFSGSETLVAAGGEGTASYSYMCDTPGETVYLACSVSQHCANGQKVELSVSSAVHVHDPATGELVLHMKSLAMMMKYLSYPAMETGFGSEAQANATLDLIWCLEPHCPGSAQDFHPDATLASCKADVHNLAGFVSRSRPVPQYAHALAYYDAALGFEPTHCATLEYRTELFLQVGNASAAVAAAVTLCENCGPTSDMAVMAQAAFAASALAPYPEAACKAFTPPSPPPPVMRSPSPPPPSPLRPAAADGGSGLAVGAIVGIAVGVVVLGVLVAAALCRSRVCKVTPAKPTARAGGVPEVEATPVSQTKY